MQRVAVFGKQFNILHIFKAAEQGVEIINISVRLDQIGGQGRSRITVFGRERCCGGRPAFVRPVGRLPHVSWPGADCPIAMAGSAMLRNMIANCSHS